MYSKIYFCILALGIVGQVSGFSKGAPDNDVICTTLTPKHKDKVPQTSPSPYSISLDKNIVSPGDIVTLSITGDFINNVTLKGLLVQGRNSNFEEETTPIGTFLIDNKGKETHRGVKCSEVENSSVTHINNDEKYEVSVKWMAPMESGKYVLLSTVVKDGYTFWVRQPSEAITVA